MKEDNLPGFLRKSREQREMNSDYFQDLGLGGKNGKTYD